MPRKKRDYKKEYREYHAKPEQKKRRAARNTARAQAVKKHGKAALRGKDVDHKDYNPRNNSSKNKRIISSKANRSRQPKRK